jgi:hypothetical protein
MDHEKPEAVYPQIFEFTPGHQISIHEQVVEYNGVTPDIEISSTLVEDRTDAPPPGDESLR